MLRSRTPGSFFNKDTHFKFSILDYPNRPSSAGRCHEGRACCCYVQARVSLANNAADFGTAGAAAHFSRLKWGSVDRHPRKNVDKFGEGMGAERGRKRERGGVKYGEALQE